MNYLSAKLVKNKDLEVKTFEGEAIVLNPKEGSFYKLNEVGTVIFQNANGKTSVKKIVEKICKEFDVKKDKAEKDTLKFVKDLEKKKFIKLKK